MVVRWRRDDSNHLYEKVCGRELLAFDRLYAAGVISTEATATLRRLRVATNAADASISENHTPFEVPALRGVYADGTRLSQYASNRLEPVLSRTLMGVEIIPAEAS